MKQLSKLQSIVFLVGGALMVIGVGGFVLLFYQRIFCWIFLLGAVLFAYGFFRELCGSYENYITYLYNKWVAALLLAAILEVYTVHRIDHELSKKNIKA